MCCRSWASCWSISSRPNRDFLGLRWGGPRRGAGVLPLCRARGRLWRRCRCWASRRVLPVALLIAGYAAFAAARSGHGAGAGLGAGCLRCRSRCAARHGRCASAAPRHAFRLAPAQRRDAGLDDRGLSPPHACAASGSPEALNAGRPTSTARGPDVDRHSRPPPAWPSWPASAWTRRICRPWRGSSTPSSASSSSCRKSMSRASSR